MIHNTLGEDAKIFDIDEEPSPSKLYQRIQQNPDYAEEESFYTKILNKFNEIKEEYPDIVSSLEKFPPRVKVAKKYNSNELVVFIKKRKLYITYCKYPQEGRFELSPITLEEAIEKIKCTPNEPSLPFSQQFWDAYEKVKQLKEPTYSRSEKSLEQQAINVLKTLQKRIPEEEIKKYHSFINTLLEDIIDYGTLPQHTLRRIANLEINGIQNAIKELEQLKNELGEDYLEKEKKKIKKLKKEIIVAIENQKQE